MVVGGGISVCIKRLPPPRVDLGSWTPMRREKKQRHERTSRRHTTGTHKHVKCIHIHMRCDSEETPVEARHSLPMPYQYTHPIETQDPALTTGRRLYFKQGWCVLHQMSRQCHRHRPTRSQCAASSLWRLSLLCVVHSATNE